MKAPHAADISNGVKPYYEKDKQEGIQQGVQQGQTMTKQQIVQAMANNNLSPQKIAAQTTIPLDEVLALLKK